MTLDDLFKLCPPAKRLYFMAADEYIGGRWRDVLDHFCGYYKPTICSLVGFGSKIPELQTTEAYDLLYDAVLFKLEQANKRRKKSTKACKLWTGDVSKSGWPMASVGGSSVLAHREAYRNKYKFLAEEEFVFQTCRNRLCVEPAHLVAFPPKNW